jgi:hypothetical protein
LVQAVEAMLVQTLPTGLNMTTSGKTFGLTQPDVLSAIFSAAATSLAAGKQTPSVDTVGVGGPFPWFAWRSAFPVTSDHGKGHLS